MTVRVEVEDPPSDESHDVVRNGLIAYNRKATPDAGFARVQVIARDDTGTICGGAIGYAQWGELYVDLLWVADEARGQGIGSRIMQQVEEEAARRGCHRVHLGTMSSQAPGFYPRIGYTEYARFGGNPKHPQRLLFYKDIPLRDQPE